MHQQVPLDDFLTRAAQDPLALARLSRVFANMGDKARAREIARQALRAAPNDAEIESLVADVLSKDVPRWHFALVQDGARNAAYAAALERAVTPQTRVLEIGTGTGILAMMAARAGAKHVVTCEMMPAIAETAEEIVTLNGYADRVRVIAKKSYDLDPDKDLGGVADLLVSEIVGNRIIGEDVLPVTEHAARRLLKPGAKIIPARGIIRVTLAYDAEIHRVRMGTTNGFDLSPFNRLAPNSYLIERGSTGLSLLSAPADLFDFNFQSGGPFPATTATTTVISTGGRCNGIAQWVALQMDEEGWYENNPAPRTSSAWAVIFWPFAAPRDCSAGVVVKVWGSHDRQSLRIWA